MSNAYLTKKDSIPDLVNDFLNGNSLHCDLVVNTLA